MLQNKTDSHSSHVKVRQQVIGRPGRLGVAGGRGGSGRRRRRVGQPRRGKGRRRYRRRRGCGGGRVGGCGVGLIGRRGLRGAVAEDDFDCVLHTLPERILGGYKNSSISEINVIK